jgi:hypothetical protein
MDLEKLQDAVDRARLQMWTERGVQLGLDFTAPFTEYLWIALDLDAPTASSPQPKIEYVGVDAQIATSPNVELHKFKPNRGGVNCIECDMTEENGYHKT